MNSLSPASILMSTLGKLLGRSKSEANSEPLIVQQDSYYRTDFGEQRVVNPYTLFDLVNKYEIDANELETSTATGGTVTFDGTNSSIALAVTTSNGSTAKLRTSTYFRYQAGKEMVVKLTTTQSALVANQSRRWGFFDDSDGLFFQTTGTTIQVVRRSSSSVATDTVDQANWNIDKLDGSGPSGKTLDITKGNIYEIHFQWLGVGTVRFYVNGNLVHVMNHAGVVAGPYMRIAQLPLSWEVVNTGASTASTFKAICASVLVMGGQEPPGNVQTAFNSTARNASTSVLLPVLSIRPKQTYGGITNRSLIYPTLLSVSNEGNRAGFRVVLNPTLTGATWAGSMPSDSKCDMDEAATSYTGGTVLFRGFLPNSQDAQIVDLRPIFNTLDRKLRRQAFTPANGDIITIAAINEGNSGSSSVRVSLTNREIGLCTQRFWTL